ncbi:MAG: single-stranded DNA-binding protein [Candidatus Saccharibacteria bacterium]|nr:single-stranded DNA-binding protein [Candidatus Saccharibacteria bacterium]
MRGFSKAIITGNVTRDPELRSTSSGNSVCSFSVAVNRTYRGSDGENKEEVSYIDCSAWGKPGEIIAQYAKKGSGILVSGRLSQRSFEGKDGVKRSRTEIVVEDFNFIGGSSRDGGGSYSGQTTSAPAEAASSDMPTDIPEGEVDLSEIPF